MDFFHIDEHCEISNCSLFVLLLSIFASLLLALFLWILRRRILRMRQNRIQIKKAPQSSSDLSVFPILRKQKSNKYNSNLPLFEQNNLKTSEIAQKHLKNQQLIPTTKPKIVSNTDRAANKPINNYINEPKVLSEQLQVEYFEDNNGGTDITTIPKERRGLDKNNSGLELQNFCNNNCEFNEKNFENFMKLKNKTRMFNNDDSIEFEDVENLDINHSERGSFKIENKLEIQQNENILKELYTPEPKFTRDSEPFDKSQFPYINNRNNFNNIRDFSSEGMNPYIENEYEVEDSEEQVKEIEKNDGLEIVKEELEED